MYDYSQDLSSFVDQPDVITHVAIVNPKPGVFVDEINYLLILCTPLTVILLGVSSTDVLGSNRMARKEIKLFDLDMSVQCDVEMISVAGTADGRIFMAGSQDGHLYELHYQEKEGWFGRRVQLINHSVSSVQSFFPRLTTPRAEGTHRLLPSPAVELQFASRSHRFCCLRPEEKPLLHADREQHHLRVLPGEQQVRSAFTDDSKSV
jgi:nuclear pore complex protein Nup155